MANAALYSTSSSLLLKGLLLNYLVGHIWYGYNQDGALWMTYRLLTLFRMEDVETAHGWKGRGGQKGWSSLKSVIHIIQWWNLAVISYLKKIQKLYESRDTAFNFPWWKHYFTRNQQMLLCLKNCRYRLHFDYNF